MLRTACVCGLEFTSPTRGYRHAQRFSAKHAHFLKENGPRTEVKTAPMVYHSPPDMLRCEASCIDRGDPWDQTPCLCNCHYVGQTSRQMAKGLSTNADSDDQSPRGLSAPDRAAPLSSRDSGRSYDKAQSDAPIPESTTSGTTVQRAGRVSTLETR